MPDFALAEILSPLRDLVLRSNCVGERPNWLITASLALCDRGYLETTKRFVHIFGVSKQEMCMLNGGAFKLCCKRGHFALAKWLIEHFSIGPSDVRVAADEPSESQRTFESCLENGHLEVAKLLFDKFSLNAADAKRATAAFVAWCSKGRLEIPKWIVEKGGVPSQQIVDKAMSAALVIGNVEIVKWLATDCLETNAWEDAYARTLALFCENAPLALVEWFADAFFEKIENVHAIKIPIMCICCRRGNVDVAAYVADKFDVGTEHVRWEDNFMFRDRCACGDVAFAKWLKSRFSLDINVIRIDAADALFQSCMNGHRNVVEWLLNDVGLTIDDVKMENARAIRGCKESFRPEFLQMLADKFGDAVEWFDDRE